VYGALRRSIGARVAEIDQRSESAVTPKRSCSPRRFVPDPGGFGLSYRTCGKGAEKRLAWRLLQLDVFSFRRENSATF
jgi:hypothetical protein